MDIMELMRSRHSVRQYLDKPIPQELRNQLNAYTERLNAESGLHIQIPEGRTFSLSSWGSDRGRALLDETEKSPVRQTVGRPANLLTERNVKTVITQCPLKMGI